MTDLLSIVLASDKRRNLLILLNSGPKEWDEIKRTLKVTSTGMLPQIKILEDEHLIERNGKKISLTPIGKVLTAHMTPFVKTTEIFDRNKKYWIEHDITVIPHEILIDIRKLGNYRIIENTSEEYFDVSVFLHNLSTAKAVKGLAHAVHPRFPKFFMDLAKKGVTSSLIFTPGVVKNLRDKYPGWIEEFLSLEKTSLYVTKKDIKFSYAVSDTYFSISLFFASGTFDTMNDLTSHDPSAIEWGEQIFEYLLGQSEKIGSPD